MSVSVALAIVALLGYVVGLLKKYQVDRSQAREELARAQAVIRDLENISRDVRGNLAAHHATILQFKDRIASLQKDGTAQQNPQLIEEAERILKPTLELAQQITKAYDDIRLQAANLTPNERKSTALENRVNDNLERTLQQYFALFARYGNKFSIVLLDIDQLQKINDAHGREHGDVLLEKIKKLLELSLRETDIVSQITGEEYALLLPETDLPGACIVAERVRAKVESELALTISGGAASAMETDSAKTLLTRADTALYSAKSAGGNKIFQHLGRQITEVKAAELYARLKANAATGEPRSGSVKSVAP